MFSFASESTIHGINFIFSPSKSRASKFFWTISFIFSFCGFCYYLHEAYIKLFIIPEVAFKVSQRPMSELPFPAVTLCTPIFSKRKIASFRNKDTEEFFNIRNTHVNANQVDFIVANEHWCQTPTLVDITQSISRRNINRTIDIVKLLDISSLSVDKVIDDSISPQFSVTRGESITSLIKFDKILTDNGFCYTTNLQNHDVLFNKIISSDFDSYKRRILKTSSYQNINSPRKEEVFNDTEQWSLDKGYPNDEMVTYPARAISRNYVSLQLKIEQDDWSNYCKGKQFSIILHLPNEIPTPFHETIPFEYNRQLRFRLNAVSHKSDPSFRRFAPFKRGCYYENERKLKFFKTYTKAHCDFECLTLYTKKVCNCSKFSMPRANKTRLCTLSESGCYTEALENWANNTRTKNSDKPCDCLSTCTDIKYSLSVDLDAQMSKHLQTKFIGVALIEVHDYVSEVHETIVNYKIQNFIADVGGLLGLFLGCSLLSIVELFYFAAIVIFGKPKSKWAKPTKMVLSKVKEEKQKQKMMKLRRGFRRMKKQIKFLLRLNNERIDIAK